MKKFRFFLLLFGFIFMIPNTKALDVNITDQGYYFHGNYATMNSVACSVNNSTPYCNPPLDVGSSPWVLGSEVDFQYNISPGTFSGTAEIYVTTLTPNTGTFYNRGISSANVRLGIGTSKFPSHLSNVTNLSITNFEVVDLYIEGTQGNYYTSKITFNFKGETTLNGTYWVKIGIAHETSTDLLYQVSGSPSEVAFMFTDGENVPYKSRVDFNSGDKTNQYLGSIDQNIGITNDKLDETNDKLDETNKELEDLNQNITDESAPNTDNLSDASGWLPPGPLDSLINLPLSLFNAISRDLSATCEPIVLPLPYVDKNLTLPCIASLYDKIGIQDFINWVGRFVSAFILFSYLMKLYKWVDDTLSFRENNHLDNWGGI